MVSGFNLWNRGKPILEGSRDWWGRTLRIRRVLPVDPLSITSSVEWGPGVGGDLLVHVQGPVAQNAAGPSIAEGIVPTNLATPQEFAFRGSRD
jgi:hypothetical protein